MKLNFWQWIGILLLVVGAILLFTRSANNRPVQTAPPATQSR